MKDELLELAMLIKKFYETDPDGIQLDGKFIEIIGDGDTAVVYFSEEGEDYKMAIRNYKNYTPQQNFELWCDSAWAWDTI